MKTKLMRRLGLVASVLAMGWLMVAAGQKPGLVVHEWGTFTSLQGSDGVPLKWNLFESSNLPKFVYDWSRAGNGRRTTSTLFASTFTKAAVTSLQRMETPVIYFYSDRERSVDVSVGFPQGLITEWYPQAGKLGPSTSPPPASVTRMDSWLHKWGVSGKFSTASIFGGGDVKESMIGWTGVRVLPNMAEADAARSLPVSTSGSHYTTARETDAAMLKVAVVTATNQTTEHEKFLFYRGVANFTTPLKVSMPADDTVTVANTGKEPLRHLFVLKLGQGVGRILYFEQLSPGTQRNVTIAGEQATLPTEKLAERISRDMAAALVKEGLYPREASAMVNTWKDSWFAESGVRVLYVLPREWTERTLPMSLSTEPTELVRVMVGRADVVPPGVERALVQEDANFRRLGIPITGDTMKNLGRFGPAAREHALANAPSILSAR